MDEQIIIAGIGYETLLLRAKKLTNNNNEMNPDRRQYYLLYYIRQGIDLRETGYWPQFNAIKDNVIRALQQFLNYELHPEEKAAIKNLLAAIETVYAERALGQTISKALLVTQRLK